MFARRGRLWISLSLIGVLAGCAQPARPVAPIDNSQSAQVTLEQIMGRLRDGDVRSVETVMTPRLVDDERAEGGWLEHPQRVTAWHLVDDETSAAARPAAANPQAVDLQVSYQVASGDSMYPGDYDIWTFIQDGHGTWLLADILGDQGL